MSVTAISPRIESSSLESEIWTLKLTIEALRNEMQLRDQQHEQAIRRINERLDVEMPLLERLATLEGRLLRS